jgi:2-dehydro-3-deoxyphosphogluconate aldolase/(4S)-4-hydroxy-2-oxoglutarate aldolase
MNMKNYPSDHTFTALEVMQDAPVIPVIVVDEVADAVPMAKALLEGGIRMLEVTLRTPKALTVMEAISKEVAGVVVGVGTVRNAEQAKAATRAGARFAVSPGITVEVARACRDLGLALLPGVATASEVMLAQEEGFSELKFFPAVQAGGVKMLQAFAGPFTDVKFCPTGGINTENAKEFLSLKNVVCVGGSWLVPQKAIEDKDWKQITALARHAKSLRVF